MLRWGDYLLHAYGKRRDAAWDRDFTLRYLGYSTDNGAFCTLDIPTHASIAISRSLAWSTWPKSECGCSTSFPREPCLCYICPPVLTIAVSARLLQHWRIQGL